MTPEMQFDPLLGRGWSLVKEKYYDCETHCNEITKTPTAKSYIEKYL